MSGRIAFRLSEVIPWSVLVIDFLHIAIRVCIHAVSRLRTIVFIKSLRGYDVGK